MPFEPFEWYCKPVYHEVLSKAAENAFGAYTLCAYDTLVMCLSQLVLFGLCLNRIWRLLKDFSVQRFHLRSNLYNYVLGLLALFCTVELLCRLLMGISAFDVDDQPGLAPYEMVSLIIETVAWCSMLVMIGVETKVYIRESRWSVRFGVVYSLLGQAVMLNLALPCRDHYDWHVFYLYISEVTFQAVFGVMLLVHMPMLVPYTGYSTVQAEFVDYTAYEALPGEEQVCPERHVNMFSRITFAWISPIMQLGYKRPLTEKDVWKLDTWDRTEVLNNLYLQS